MIFVFDKSRNQFYDQNMSFYIILEFCSISFLTISFDEIDF